MYYREKIEYSADDFQEMIVKTDADVSLLML